MVLNYIKIGLRVFQRDFGHTLINILGLGLGVACCLLIALFVRDEWSFDQFHHKGDDIYRAYVKEDYGPNQTFFNTVTPFPLGPALKDNFSEVKAQVRILPTTTLVESGEQRYSEAVHLVGENFFDTFDFSPLKGDPGLTLESQRGLVITSDIARKYFGEGEALGKALKIRMGTDFEDFEIRAVVENPPSNSSIQFGFLISDFNLGKIYDLETLTNGWFNVQPETYILLQAGTDPTLLESQFPALFKTILGNELYNNSNYQVGLQPLQSLHLDTSYPRGQAPVSNPQYSYILAGVALLILVVACINYVTLAIGRSLRRIKEVGIRKVVGAARNQLLGQFLTESMLITILSVALGVLLARLCLATFNDLAGKQLSLSLDGFNILILVVLAFITGLIAGSYPAYILSVFNPADIIKGKSSVADKHRLKKVLVGVQIFISVFLITGTLFMGNQLRYIQTKDLGYDREHIMVIPLNITDSQSLPELINTGFEKAQILKNELLKVPQIKASCASSHDFGNGNWTTLGFTDQQGIYRDIFMNVIDEDYLNALGIELAQGRAFSRPGDRNSGILVNQALVDEFGWEDPLGRSIPGQYFKSHQVIGVVKDFNYASLYQPVEPLALVMDPALLLSGAENININNSPSPKLLVKINHTGLSETINTIADIWKSTNLEGDFNYSFVDQTLAVQYRDDSRLSKIIKIATWLAIIIGCMGLYALASLAMQQRLKEISIRRVLGATGTNLALLLSREYAVMVVIAFVASVPFTWILLKEWLASFAYRIPITADKFLLAGLLALLVALITISYRTFKTIRINPVDILKSE